MSEHVATISWKRSSAEYTAQTYNRGHEWKFDSGVVVPASASPLYRGDASRCNPRAKRRASVAARVQRPA